MTTTRFQIDTADRLGPLSYFRHDGQTLFVERVEPNPTPARPARLAVYVNHPGDRLCDPATPVYLDAGDTVPQYSVHIGRRPGLPV